MAKQQELKSIISVYGRMDTSFTSLSKQIKAFGSEVSKVGTGLAALTAPALAAGKASLDLFTDYDDVMKSIQAVGGYTTAQMETISTAARDAGKNTRFMATDAGNAILYLTQAGVGLEGTLDVLPSLLNAAAAGSMDLATSSDLLISNIYSLGKTFSESDVTTYIDAVTTAADATNTNLQEIMEGVSRIGSAGRMFGGGDNELLAFLGLLSNLNLKGSEGGVNARNMMISLLAPTDKAGKMMEALAVSEEEMGEALEDVNLEDSAALMRELGLQTVDAEGKVRPMIDILTDLKKGMDGMADDEIATTLYTIFGKRTYPAVAGLLELLNQYPDLLKQIEESSGSTAEKAEILESGIGGARRELSSALEELGISAGDALDEHAIELMGSARDIILQIADGISNTDPETVETITDSVLVLAGAGIGLTVAGKGIELIGSGLALLGNPAGQVLLAAAAIGLTATSLKNLHDEAVREDMESHFGSLQFDAETMKTTISGLSTEFETGMTKLSGYAEAVDLAGTNYTEAVTGLSAGVLDAVFRDVTIGEEDAAALFTYAGNMVTELKNALGLQKLQIEDFIDLAYDGSNEGDAEKNGAWSSMVDAVMGDLEAEATQAGQELRSALTRALQDDKINAEEQQAIAASQMRMNAIMDEIMSFQNEMDANIAYAKATDMSWGTIEDHIGMVQEMWDASDRATDDAFYQADALIRYYEKHGLALGDDLQALYGVGAHDYAGAYAANAAEREAQKLDNHMAAAEPVARILNYALSQYGDGLGAMGPLVDSLLSGAMTLDEATYERQSAMLEDDNYSIASEAVEEVLAAVERILPVDKLAAMIERQERTQGAEDADLYALYRSMIGAKMYTGDLFFQDTTLLGATGTEDGRVYVDAVQTSLNETPLLPVVEQPDGAALGNKLATDAQAALDSHPLTISVRQNNGGFIGSRAATTLDKYAEGGRSTVPAIFGEAGAEWAIPEEHTQRTAELLASAAKASGFSMGEILARTGGLNASAATAQFVFSPTIYANDARGVEEALARGKQDLEEWFEARMRQEERMSYA